MISRNIAFFLALTISVISSAIMWVALSITIGTTLIAALIIFVFSFTLIKILLDVLFFRHLNAIYDMLDKIENNDFSMPIKQSQVRWNPLRRIDKEIYNYASSKQEEISRLKQLAKYRREFVADISHELKTPLFAAQGFVHTLMDGAVGDKQVRDKFLKKAAKSLDGLDILVEDLLTISQIESGEIKMHYENFDAVEVSLQVLELMEVKAEKKGLRVLLENEDDEKILVHADSRRIFQVLTNLVSNAIKYTDGEGDIFIRFIETKSDVICSVIDRGVGIPEEDIPRIFERFYRVDKSRSKGGTGLGLAIVKHIIEGHGAQVRVMSKINKGSTFSFNLKKA